MPRIFSSVFFSGTKMNGPVQYIGLCRALCGSKGLLFSISQYGKQINYNLTFGIILAMVLK